MSKIIVTDVYLNLKTPDFSSLECDASYQYEGFSIVPRVGEKMQVVDRGEGIDFEGVVEAVESSFENRGSYQIFFVQIALRGRVRNEPRNQTN